MSDTAQVEVTEDRLRVSNQTNGGNDPGTTTPASGKQSTGDKAKAWMAGQLAKPKEKARAEWRLEVEDGVANRLKHHALPWIVASVTFVTAAFGWGLNASYTDDVGSRSLRGLVLGGILAGVACLLRRKRTVWCPKRANTATVAIGMWTFLAVVTGWTPVILWLLAVTTVAISIGYWRDIYIPDTAAERDALDKPVLKLATATLTLPIREPTPGSKQADVEANRKLASQLEERWERYVSAKGGHLPGIPLSNRQVSDVQIDWDVTFPEDASTLNEQLEDKLKQISRAFRLPEHKIQATAHPSGDNLLATLSVILQSDCDEVQEVTAPHYYWDGGEGYIEFGSHFGSTDPAKLLLYSENSMHDVLILGAKGSGKTSTMSFIAGSAMSSGHTCVFYLDGSPGGAGNSLLRKYAHWSPTGPDAETVLLDGLERAMAERAMYMELHGLQGLTPTPEMPGILVALDECQWFFGGPNEDRWLSLIRVARKYCISIMAVTQDSGGESFGSAALRDMLSEVTLIGLKGKGTDRGVGIGVETDDLPSAPGWGKMEGRQALELPFRAWRLRDKLEDDEAPESETPAEKLLRETPVCELDRMTANAFGDRYARRHELAQQRRDWLAKRQDPNVDLDELWAEHSDPASTDNDGDADGDDLDAALAALAEVSGDTANVFDGLSPAAQSALRAITDGATRRVHIRNATGYGNSSVTRAVEELEQVGAIVQNGHGSWRLADDE